MLLHCYSATDPSGRSYSLGGGGREGGGMGLGGGGGGGGEGDGMGREMGMPSVWYARTYGTGSFIFFQKDQWIAAE